MPTTTPPSPTEPLARLVRQKRRLLEQMVKLCTRQGELITEGDTTTLLQLLGGKQQLIAGLQVIERGLDAFRHQDPDSRPWPSAADRAACKADADACNQLLAEVVATEREHESQMTDRRDSLSKQLLQAQSAHAASTAYKPHLRGGRQPAVADPSNGAPLSTSLDLTSSD